MTDAIFRLKPSTLTQFLRNTRYNLSAMATGKHSLVLLFLLNTVGDSVIPVNVFIHKIFWGELQFSY